MGLETGAFAQLTTRYMEEKFNKLVLDDPSVRYFSYGAMAKPGIMSVFRQSHRIIEEKEGPNDGMLVPDWGVDLVVQSSADGWGRAGVGQVGAVGHV